MGEAGRRYVESNYGWEVVLRRYEHLMARTVGRWAPGSLRTDAGAGAAR